MVGEGRRAGVGLVLEARGRGPSFVAELAPGGSADRSGRVRVGDQLESVDGQLVNGKTPSDLSQIISGPEGTYVTLAFRRVVSTFFTESEDSFEVTLVRAMPQSLSAARAPAPEAQPPGYGKLSRSEADSPAYMGDATVLPPQFSSHEQGAGRLPVQHRHSVEIDPQRPTTFHGFIHYQASNSYMPDTYSSNRKSIQTSPQAERRPGAWQGEAQARPTATGTPTHMRQGQAAAPTRAAPPDHAAEPAAGDIGEPSDVTMAAPAEESADIRALAQELQTLLTFIKSGYTNATHPESEFMQVSRRPRTCAWGRVNLCAAIARLPCPPGACLAACLGHHMQHTPSRTPTRNLSCLLHNAVSS
jgi:hypothetical protein